MPKPDDTTLLASFRQGDRRSLARLLTRIENEDNTATRAMLHELYSQTGQAWRIGVTGPPGAGKSTLVNRLVLGYRQADESVGVIAFDPTSPFTGGALLGDRVRMEMASEDPGVFIRSMATRGHLGGLAVSVDEACDLLDAFGKGRILVETVGVGQSELEVAHSTDTTLVVLVPESGDAIQAMKAGLMEIADIFVLNKSDREGADRAYRELVSTIELKEADSDGWKPPVVLTSAEKGEGVEELIATVGRHHDYLIDKGLLEGKRRQRLAEKTRRLAEHELARRIWTPERVQKRADGLEQAGSPYELSRLLLDEFLREIADEREQR